MELDSGIYRTTRSGGVQWKVSFLSVIRPVVPKIVVVVPVFPILTFCPLVALMLHPFNTQKGKTRSIEFTNQHVVCVVFHFIERLAQAPSSGGVQWRVSIEFGFDVSYDVVNVPFCKRVFRHRPKKGGHHK